MSWYVELLFGTYQLAQGGFTFHGWPDGGTLLSQPRKFVVMSRIFKDEVEEWWKVKNRK